MSTATLVEAVTIEPNRMFQEARIRNRGARFLMVTASLVIVVAGLREIKPIALPLVVAIFLSVLSAPLLDWLTRRGVPRLIGVLATVLANVAVIAAMLLLVGSSLSAFANSWPEYRQRFEAKGRSTVEWLEKHGINTRELDWLRGPPPVRGIGEILDEAPAAPDAAEGDVETALGPSIALDSIFDLVTSTVRGVASLFTMGLLIFLMMVFILFETASLPRKLEIALGWGRSDLARMALAQREIQRYLGIKTMISLATGLLAYLWVLWLDIEFPLLWGILAFALNFIPSLGSIIAAIPAMLMALIQSGTGQALLVGLGYLVINVALGNTVEPHLMGRRLGISTLVVFISLIFWGWVWGPIGMLLAVPLTMVLKIVLEHTEDFRWMALLISARPAPLEPRPTMARAGLAATLAPSATREKDDPERQHHAS